MTDTDTTQEVTHDLTAFFASNHRYPRIGDEIAPWNYRGWLLPYVIDAPQFIKGLPDRWGYLLRTREAGRLLDEPIPQIHFSHADPAVLKQVQKWIETVDRYEGGWSSFLRLIEWLAWALAVSKYQPKLRDGADETLYRGVNIIPLLEKPADYLGTILSEMHATGWNPNAFYPTPHEVVEMMVRMTLADGTSALERQGPGGKDMRAASVMDPCVGTGRMLLHASNFSMNLYGQDIDQTVCTISKINAALYVPWIVAPLPDYILGRAVPEPPPAPLPVPNNEAPAFRCDDKGQGMLF